MSTKIRNSPSGNLIDVGVIVAAALGFATTNSQVDNRRALQAAADQARDAGGATILSPEGTYPYAGNVTLYSNTRIEMSAGTVLDMSQAGSVDAFRASGSEGAQLPLTANALKGALSLQLSSANAATLAARDWIRVASNALFDASSTASKIGELVQVASVAGTTVTLETPLCDTYNTADTAVVTKVTFVENIHFSDGKILGGGTPTAVGSDVNQNGIRVLLGYNIIVDKTRFERIDLSGVWYQDCVFSKVIACDFRDAFHSQQAYGVLLDNACQDCEVMGLTGARTRHLFTTGNSTTTRGITRRFTVSHCHAYSTTPARGGGGGDAFDTHTAAEFAKFSHCVSHYSTGAGFNIECPSVVMVACESYFSTDAGLVFHNESDREGVLDCQKFKSVSSSAEGIRVTHPTRGSVARVKSAKLDDCRVEDSTGISFFIANTVNTLTLRNVVLSDCVVTGCKNANASIWLQNVEVGKVSANVSEPTQVAAQLIRIRDSLNVLVEGCTLRHADNATGIAIYINATGAALCQKIEVDSNRAGALTPVGLRGVFADTNARNCRLGDNDFQECNTAIDLQSGTGHRLYQQPACSGNNGDTSPTLTVNSAPTQFFSTPITANRSVGAPTASLCDGLEFEVVREAGATGAFTISVFGVVNLATAGTSARVKYSASAAAWKEVSASTL